MAGFIIDKIKGAILHRHRQADILGLTAAIAALQAADVALQAKDLLLQDAAVLTPLVISANANATLNRVHIITAGGITLTLPAAPAATDRIKVINLSGLTTSKIGRNGKKIMNLAEDLTIDKVNAGFELYFSGDTYGWLIL